MYECVSVLVYMSGCSYWMAFNLRGMLNEIVHSIECNDEKKSNEIDVALMMCTMCTGILSKKLEKASHLVSHSLSQSKQINFI